MSRMMKIMIKIKLILLQRFKNNKPIINSQTWDLPRYFKNLNKMNSFFKIGKNDTRNS